MGVEGCVSVKEQEGRADWLSLLLNCSAYDKAHVLSGSLGVSAFFPASSR